MASKKRNKNPFEHRNRNRAISKAKKQHRRGKSERKPRRRDWESYDGEAGQERIMPMGEAERRQQIEQAAQTVFTEETDIPETPQIAAFDATVTGRVVEVSSGMCRVQLDDERILLCTLRGSLTAEETGYTNAVTVGDRVHIAENNDLTGRVEAVEPRTNEIARPAPSAPHLRQLLAANVDQLLIVQAWRNPDIWYELIDRYLITAERSGVRPVICVNKVDLSDDIEHIRAETAPYTALGYEVLLTSAADGHGLDALREQLHGKVTAVAGLSGVGKSSLLAAVQPGFSLRTGEVNEERGQGRHTTTQATMMSFGDDGYVIDTPGIREFGLAGLHAPELDRYYPEVARAASCCKFADCTHTHEPDCGVLEELETGGLSHIRYHNYTVIRSELPA